MGNYRKAHASFVIIGYGCIEKPDGKYEFQAPIRYQSLRMSQHLNRQNSGLLPGCFEFKGIPCAELLSDGFGDQEAGEAAVKVRRVIRGCGVVLDIGRFFQQ